MGWADQNSKTQKKLKICYSGEDRKRFEVPKQSEIAEIGNPTIMKDRGITSRAQ